MSSCNAIERVVITPGSKAEFWVDLFDESTGRPLALDVYPTSKAVFCNCNGDLVEVTLDTVNDNGKCGSVNISIPSVDTALFDKGSTNFDLVLVDAFSETTIIPIKNKIEIVERSC